MIVNADSSQVYRDLPILSAAPTEGDRTLAEHCLYGFLDGSVPGSAADWAARAKAEIHGVQASGRLPILVGGTGLYLRTLIEGIAPVPPIDPRIRATVRDRPIGENRAELAKLDVIQKYAYTKACRRGFVLRYFGDPAARSKCQGCDNCLGINHGRPAAVATRQRKPRQRDRTAKSENAVALQPNEKQLFEALRARRSEIARDEKVPAFVVFSDRTLVEIATSRPSSLAAFSRVHGVGGTKLERYGEKFLAVIRQQSGS